MTQHGDDRWFDDDDEDDDWADAPWGLDDDGPDHDLPDPPGARLGAAGDALAVLLDLVGLRAKAKGTTFAAQHDLPLQQFAAHGGAFPVRVRDVGIVGVVTVSGLPQADDHALVVEAVAAHLS